MPTCGEEEEEEEEEEKKEPGGTKALREFAIPTSIRSICAYPTRYPVERAIPPFKRPIFISVHVEAESGWLTLDISGGREQTPTGRPDGRRLREDLIEIMPCIKAARSGHSLPLGLIRIMERGSERRGLERSRRTGRGDSQ
ncbi:hypothetical protein TEQG_04365 [Trichophyton equinum CBS 127.97]|uniref:Uncharacterized protein n=1 Tax=Trichophyton equinum (strain ATCC MYA-4606 / CBS 127.97) TaxID=559882 RepID=F2PTI9_TRIEC|nr:hypothetical protein TEQG_04365 [Trichophyton equinum CBS 127.97]